MQGSISFCGHRLRASAYQWEKGAPASASLHLNCIHETAVNQFAWLVEGGLYIIYIIREQKMRCGLKAGRWQSALIKRVQVTKAQGRRHRFSDFDASQFSLLTDSLCGGFWKGLAVGQVPADVTERAGEILITLREDSVEYWDLNSGDSWI